MIEIKNAIIERAILDMGDRGLLTGWVFVDYGGCSQGFGGYALYLPKSYTHHKLMSCAGHWIFRVMEIAGTESWEKLSGKTIRVKIVDGIIEAIGHIVKDDWFCPSDDFKEAE